jgi:hypothetical protein
MAGAHELEAEAAASMWGPVIGLTSAIVLGIFAMVAARIVGVRSGVIRPADWRVA